MVQIRLAAKSACVLPISSSKCELSRSLVQRDYVAYHKNTIQSRYFIGAIPSRVCRAELFEYFCQFGAVQDIYLPRSSGIEGNSNFNSGGFGFLKIDSERKSVNSQGVGGTWHELPKRGDRVHVKTASDLRSRNQSDECPSTIKQQPQEPARHMYCHVLQSLWHLPRGRALIGDKLHLLIPLSDAVARQLKRMLATTGGPHVMVDAIVRVHPWYVVG